MTFRFGLFRVTSIVNLVVSGFFGIIMALGMLIAPNPAYLIGLFLIGAAGIHAWLSITLQRSLSHGMPLKEQTPSGIRIIGLIAAFFAFIVMSSAITILKSPDTILRQMMEMNPDSGLKAKDMPAMRQAYVGMAIFILLYGISLMINYILAMSFLQVWLGRQQQQQDDDTQF